MQVRQNHFFCWFFEIFSGVFFHFNRWWFHMYTPRIVRFSSPYLDVLQIQTWRSSFLWLKNGKSWNISQISCRFQQLRVLNISVAKTYSRFISIVWLPDLAKSYTWWWSYLAAILNIVLESFLLLTDFYF